MWDPDETQLVLYLYEGETQVMWDPGETQLVLYLYEGETQVMWDPGERKRNKFSTSLLHRTTACVS